MYEALRTGVGRGCDMVVRQGITLGRRNATLDASREGSVLVVGR